MSRALSGFCLAAALGLAVLTAAPAQAAPDMKLAKGVARPADMAPAAETYVAAVDTPVFAKLDVYGPKTGAVKRGQKLDVLAEAQTHDWVLLGAKGVGVGWLPRSLVTPQKYAAQIVHPQG